jgi:hypothetical protein
MCKNCFNQIRAVLTEQNDTEKLAKLDVLEEASDFQKKTAGEELDGAQILMSLHLPIEVLKQAFKDYKKVQTVIRQMQQN